jgi:hypothetical protein
MKVKGPEKQGQGKLDIGDNEDADSDDDEFALGSSKKKVVTTKFSISLIH